MDEWRFIAERKIREAMEEGAFDDLSGTGEPLDLSEDPFEDPSLRMAHRLLRKNGFAPEWIMESREIDAEARLLRSRPAMSQEEFRRRVEVLNKRILAFNLKAPAVGVHKLPLKIEP